MNETKKSKFLMVYVMKSINSKKIFSANILTVILYFLPMIVHAQGDVSARTAILADIGKMVGVVCYDVQQKGETTKVEISGAAKAELRNLLKKFADIGLNGTAKVDIDKYEGVLQKDLAEAMKNSQTCRQDVFDKLVEKLLPAPSARSSSSDINDPAVRLNNRGFRFDEASYFTAVKAGRSDVVSDFLDAGMSPYTIRKDEYSEGTALAFAIYWESPNFCPLMAVFQKHGVDLTQRNAGGGAEENLMWLAVEVGNAPAVKCLSKYFPNQDPFKKFLSKRISLKKKINDAPINAILGNIIENCSADMAYWFGSPESSSNIENKQLSERFVSSTCFFRTVGAFREDFLGSKDGVFDITPEKNIQKLLQGTL